MYRVCVRGFVGFCGVLSGFVFYICHFDFRVVGPGLGECWRGWRGAGEGLERGRGARLERGLEWRGAGEGGPQGVEAGGAGWRGGALGLVSGLRGGLAEGFG